ncbi:MAG TPA: TIM-barrel domain-containing protein [Fimbriimonadaceae bacterium]|jgi:hypothetical protein
MTSETLTRRDLRRNIDLSGDVEIGSLRIQALSSTLLRFEIKGPKGFEDRPTFMVPQRKRGIAPLTIKRRGQATVLVFPSFQVIIPSQDPQSLDGIRVLDRFGKNLYSFGKKLPAQSFLPAPSDTIKAYAVADSPRLAPPEWGATPTPSENSRFAQTSGWDTENDSTDVFLFVPGVGGYETLRSDFLDLTGRIPMPPLWSFGFWDSQWYPYTEQEALDSIDLYRKKGFPLDVFVVDTDWRVNASHGYEISSKHFPDMGRFIAEAHKRGVRLVFNDHPEPVAPTALDPVEFAFRWQGLTSLLELGLDAWWFDRNWHTRLHEPMPGLAKEVWGQQLYHDITLRYRPNSRPMIMSNVDGIDNGNRNRPSHPASHRFPITWTGDTFAEWRYLLLGVQNAVDFGVLALQPYINEDLGGHHSHPTDEFYLRFLQFGVFSPTTRVHCTWAQERHPWSFGAEVEEIVTDYVKLRYRLLPTIYSAARQAYESGQPLLRRCDLEWPDYEGASSNEQFLFGEDLLIAPVTSSRHADPEIVAPEFLQADNGNQGLKGEYFANVDLEGEPAFRRVDRKMAFDWRSKSPRKGFPQENYSARWTGSIGPVPETGEYIISIAGDDGVRMWLDGKLVVDQWIIRTIGEDQVLVHFEAGKSYPLVIEFMQKGGPGELKLAWSLPSGTKSSAKTNAWIPPGSWVDAWTGAEIAGPQTLEIECDNRLTPIFVRSGALIATTSDSQTSGTMPWNTLVLEAFPADTDGVTERWLYEDDGTSNDYLSGEYRKTMLEMERNGNNVWVRVEPAECSFGDEKSRRIVVRLHVPLNMTATCSLPVKAFEPSQDRLAIPLAGEGSAGMPGHEVVEVSAVCSIDSAFEVFFHLETD